MECADIKQAGQLQTGTETNQDQVVDGGLVRQTNSGEWHELPNQKMEFGYQ